MLKISTLLCLALVWAVDCQAQWARSYQGEEHSLHLDLTQVAINWTQEPEATKAIARIGLNPKQMKPQGMPGWSLIRIPTSWQQSAAIDRLVRRLAKSQHIKFATPVFSDPHGGPVFPTRDLIVRCREIDKTQIHLSKLQSFGHVISSQWGGFTGAYLLRSHSSHGGDVLQQALELSRLKEVIYAEPDFCYSAVKANLPNDPDFPAQWAINIKQDVFDPMMPSRRIQLADSDLDLLEAFDLTRGDPAIKIAILDDGVQMDHPDLPIAISGVDTTTDSGVGQPINANDNHGTGIAGIIGALPNNGLGIAGGAPDSQIVAVRCYVTTPTNLITMTSWTVNALKWCETQNVRITNNSVLFSFLTNSVKDKYDSTALNGMLHFAAAGNTAGPTNRYPAKYNSVHGLMGLTELEEKWIHSASGADMAYSGPAAEIQSTDRTGNDGLKPGDYAGLSGTSYATAYASAIASLILSINPALTAPQVHDIMRSTTRDLGVPGFDPNFGAGFLNAYAATFQAALTLVDPSQNLYSQASQQSDSEFGASVAALGDMDGDGILEFAVGAPLFDGIAGNDAGRVKIYSGAKGICIATIEGTRVGEQFGFRVSAIPDIDGDNILDVAISSPKATIGNLIEAGKVSVFSGRNRALLYVVNGYTAFERFGSSLTTLNDLDSDAVGEIVIGAPGAVVSGTDSVGAIYVVSAKTGLTLVTASGSPMLLDSEFGYALTRIPDQDADAIDDILVGAPGSFNNGPNSGKVIVISGQTGLRITERSGTSAGDRTGAALATWVDQNGDGFRELVVASPGFDGPGGIDSGLVTIHSGNVANLPLQGLFFTGENPGDQFGHALVDGLDMDGDSFEDLIVGAPGFDGLSNDIGKIYSFTSDGTSRSRFEITGQSPFQQFGSSIASLLDVDKDGVGEFVIGASGSATNNTPGFSVVICAPNPDNLPFDPSGIMAGTLGLEEKGPYDVLFVNNSAGGLDRSVQIPAFETIRYSVQLPRANTTGGAHFSLFAFTGIPHPKSRARLPRSTGDALWMPCTLSPMNSIGYLLAASNSDLTCPAQFEAMQAPSVVVDSVGFPASTTITVFGLIEERADGFPRVTNAVVLQIQ